MKNKKILGLSALVILNLITTVWANHHAYCEGLDEYDPNTDSSDITLFIPTFSNFCFASMIDLILNILSAAFIFFMSALLQKYRLTESNNSSMGFYIERSVIALMFITIGISSEAAFNYLGSISDSQKLQAIDANQQIMHCYEISPSALPSLLSVCYLTSASFFLPSPFAGEATEVTEENNPQDPTLVV